MEMTCRPRSRCLPLWTSRDFVFALVLITTCIDPSLASSACGDFYDIGSTGTGTFYSPNYPNLYGIYSKCIWVIRASYAHRVQLAITFSGERYGGSCSDYLEIRDGNSTANLVGQYCDTYTGQVITSSSQWMWVKFQSDGLQVNGTVMYATFSAKYDATPSDTYDPIASCRSYEFECRNLQCLSMSYRCDSYNDCGCENGCDEDGCGELSINSRDQVIIAIGVGVAAFIVVCAIAFILEGKNNWMNTDIEGQMREKETMAEQRRRRASRVFSKFISDKESLFKM